MKHPVKHLAALLLVLCAMTSLAAPAFALEYTFGGAGGAEYGKPTSIDVVLTPDGGAAKNEDMSKNAALVPPAFGSHSADTLYTGEYLTPNLVPGTQPGAGAVVDGPGNVQYPPAASVGVQYLPAVSGGPGTAVPPAANTSSGTASGYTAVTQELYYSDGSLGTLSIPAIGLKVKVVEGTDNAALAKGAGHFPESSIWDGNVALAAHNRGTNSYFGQIHTLSYGDTVTLTTKLGTRTYSVVSVEKVLETDWSGLAASNSDMLSLYTCVRDERAFRWCVQAVEIV